MQSAIGGVPGAAVGIPEMGIAGVDQQIALFEHGRQFRNDAVDRCARRNKDDDFSGAGERGNKRAGLVATDETSVWSGGGQFCDPVRGAIEAGDFEAVIHEIEQEVAAHGAQADDSDIGAPPIHATTSLALESAVTRPIAEIPRGRAK
jgi:hypothetical protein